MSMLWFCHKGSLMIRPSFLHMQSVLTDSDWYGLIINSGYKYQLYIFKWRKKFINFTSKIWLVSYIFIEHFYYINISKQSKYDHCHRALLRSMILPSVLSTFFVLKNLHYNKHLQFKMFTYYLKRNKKSRGHIVKWQLDKTVQ